MKKQNKIEKEYRENQTSWKWFMNHLNKNTSLAQDCIDRSIFAGWQTLLLVEILKELQYLNNKEIEIIN